MKISSLLVYAGIAANSFAEAHNTCREEHIYNKCSEWNFDHHQDRENIKPKYKMQLLNVQHGDGADYDITVRFYADENIPLEHLHSVKIIGVQGPQGTIQLWGKNEGVTPQDFVPSDFTTTFKIYSNPHEDPCYVEIPNFQVQYEYKHSDTWTQNGWGKHAFDLMIGCGGDNQGNSNFDFPLYFWPKDCNSHCNPPESSVTTTTSVEPTSTPETTSEVDPEVTTEITFETTHSTSTRPQSSLVPPTTAPPPETTDPVDPPETTDPVDPPETTDTVDPPETTETTDPPGTTDPVYPPTTNGESSSSSIFVTTRETVNSDPLSSSSSLDLATTMVTSVVDPPDSVTESSSVFVTTHETVVPSFTSPVPSDSIESSSSTTPVLLLSSTTSPLVSTALITATSLVTDYTTTCDESGSCVVVTSTPTSLITTATVTTIGMITSTTTICDEYDFCRITTVTMTTTSTYTSTTTICDEDDLPPITTTVVTDYCDHEPCKPITSIITNPVENAKETTLIAAANTEEHEISILPSTVQSHQVGATKADSTTVGIHREFEGAASSIKSSILTIIYALLLFC